MSNRTGLVCCGPFPYDSFSSPYGIRQLVRRAFRPLAREMEPTGEEVTGLGLAKTCWEAAHQQLISVSTG